ncbi:hypothetical protein IFM89_038039 [Coptis chinensis]|uniref:starch synthase n=1 Tax=Coptis chinensis TaxID=261450 RepID=A0A835LCS7_9MAGN|nr:hypothetical protein IFM89_038039 [Coptis chinensis]
MGEFVKNYPQVLHASVVVELVPVVKFLRGLDVDKQNIGYVLQKYPELLGFKLNGTMSTSVVCVSWIPKKILAQMFEKRAYVLGHHSWRGLSYNHSNERLPTSSPRLILTSCKMRQRNLSFRNKTQQAKKVSPGQLPVNESFQSSCDENNTDADGETADSPCENIGDESTEVKSDIECTSSYREISIDEEFQSNDRSLNEDLDKILIEKEALQEDVNTLEMRLAETDARIKVAAQEKIHVELLESQLEKLKSELSEKGATEGSKEGIDEKNIVSNKDNDQRVIALESECVSLQATLKNLESRLVVAQVDLLKLSPLKLECKDLWVKVGSLQELINKAAKQADEAISVLQQNHEFRKKVDSLEESLEEAKLHLSSSTKMQQKIRHLEESLQRSDEEIHSHVQLYQELVQEFQDVLNNLKEESKRKASDEPVIDMPWEFWSRILLMIDGWFLEKKISSNDAELLIASPTSQGLHIIHIAAEMAPVAKVGGLGDVVSGLGKALQKKGHLVEIVIPKYDCMEYDRVTDLREPQGTHGLIVHVEAEGNPRVECKLRLICRVYISSFL